MPRVLAWLKMSLERCLQEVTFLALLKALFIVSNKEYVHDLDDQVTFISNLNKIWAKYKSAKFYTAIKWKFNLKLY